MKPLQPRRRSSWPPPTAHRLWRRAVERLSKDLGLLDLRHELAMERGERELLSAAHHDTWAALAATKAEVASIAARSDQLRTDLLERTGLQAEILDQLHQHTDRLRRIERYLQISYVERWIQAAPVESSTLVSVILPTRNREWCLAGAIDSVRQQCYPNWELIVVENGSTDNTVELMESLAEPRLRLLQTRASEPPPPATLGSMWRGGRSSPTSTPTTAWNRSG